MIPERLSEDRGSFESRLLRAGRTETPSRDAKKRAAAAAALAASSVALEAGTAFKFGFAKKLAAWLVGLSVVGGGAAAMGTYVQRQEPVLASEGMSFEPSPVIPFEVAAHAPVDLSPISREVTAALPKVVVATARPAPATAPDETPTESELSLVRRAKSQLAAGNANGALETLTARAHAYPDGVLDEEASALRILALASLSSPSARVEAARFTTKHPESPYGERIETALKKLVAPAP